MCARKLAQGRTLDSTGHVLLDRTEVSECARELKVSKQSISSAWRSLQVRGYLQLVEPGSIRLKV